MKNVIKWSLYICVLALGVLISYYIYDLACVMAVHIGYPVRSLKVLIWLLVGLSACMFVFDLLSEEK